MIKVSDQKVQIVDEKRGKLHFFLIVLLAKLLLASLSKAIYRRQADLLSCQDRPGPLNKPMPRCVGLKNVTLREKPVEVQKEKLPM